AGEILLLNGALPQVTGVVGIILIVVGIIGYSLKKS
ncbi:MAG: multidrug resistance efflux transporter family protein, partial [Deltaproteobacteria bacterium]|nr:multidrug resistance efflux transporter family protein [Deltaproteobacteria bacterium]